jgi:hypothetical protein
MAWETPAFVELKMGQDRELAVLVPVVFRLDQ